MTFQTLICFLFPSITSPVCSQRLRWSCHKTYIEEFQPETISLVLIITNSIGMFTLNRSKSLIFQAPNHIRHMPVDGELYCLAFYNLLLKIFVCSLDHTQFIIRTGCRPLNRSSIGIGKTVAC